MALIFYSHQDFHTLKLPSSVPSPKSHLLYCKVSISSTMSTTSKVHAGNLNKPFSLAHKPRSLVTHFMPPEKKELFKSLEDWAKTNVLVHLKPVEKCWQPQHFLPDPSSDGFLDQVVELRERAMELPDDYFVVLVGDMITEEALPTYQSMLNGYDGIGDRNRVKPQSLGCLGKGWSAEENRHGDLLQQDIQTENNPYLGLIYTSFQERATFISHGNTARLAKHYGDSNLAQICGTIASDEKRHEIAYTKIMENLFQIDPDAAVVAFANMMQKKIAMPAHWMYDGHDEDLFVHFSTVAQRLGVYTATDYANILEFLLDKWNVEKLSTLSSEGRKAQDYVCGLGPKIRRLEERAQLRAKKTPVIPFSWIF
ncbi:hypothetical protein LOK49_Contig508G00001 [Camellia lanceoleosa]|nr:hypothetical protein LOK49_Contig508G00001 [Camellia lanceoleosa]